MYCWYVIAESYGINHTHAQNEKCLYFTSKIYKNSNYVSVNRVNPNSLILKDGRVMNDQHI